MNKLIGVLFLFVLPALCFCQNFGGNPSSKKWNQVNTNKARVIFPKGLDSQANRISNIMALLGNTTAATLGGKQKKWNIILQNNTTIPNAYVRMAPVMSELYMVPGQDNFSTGSIRWDDNLIIHENRHIQQFSNFNKGVAKFLNVFLGQEGQLAASGIFLPNYFFEGDAVWQETLVSAQGRGRMPSFYNGFKSLWLTNKNYKWIKIRSGSLKDFVPDHYPMGYMMVAYGYEKYGADFWNKVTDDALRLKGFNRGIKRHSGKHFLTFYKDAMNFFESQSITPQEKNAPLQLITAGHKNNVVDYTYPAFMNSDTLLVSKRSYQKPDAFYFIAGNNETKIRVRDFALDDYYSYRNGKIVYAAFESDPRWDNRDYSVIRVLDVNSRQLVKLGHRVKYFSPDINESGTEVIAVNVNTNGSNSLIRLNAANGNIIANLPNPHNYFFTQTKYVDAGNAVSAVRSPEGKMALVKVNFITGGTEPLTPFTFNVMGTPFVKGDTVYFSAQSGNSDKIFAVTLSEKKIFRLTHNANGIYQPVVNTKGEMLFSSFTANGSMLAKLNLANADWQEVGADAFSAIQDLYTPVALQKNGAEALYTLKEVQNKITDYKKGLHLFNFHSWRPVVDDPEYGYTFYSDNVLSSFNNNITYTYNRSDKSNSIKFGGTYAGWFPVLSATAEHNFNRTIDTAVGKSIQINTAKLNTGFSIPLRFIGGRTFKFINLGAGYNIESYYYSGITKNVFKNKAINYVNAFFSFSNQSRQARQNIFPGFAQSISLNYRDAFTFRNSHKFVANSTFYFPGLAVNHSLVINASWQKRDSLPDLFSKNFSYSRGYEALSTRRMYKLGASYHFPLLYPDWGFANLVFFQRIRAAAFYDYTNAKARVNGELTEIKNRSIGGELYFDTKVWNALPVSIGVRYSRLLDADRFNPGVKNVWELILPIGLIPE